jgi:dihydroxy-acid dehydratase
MQLRSRNITQGVERAPHRSLLYACGFTKEELDRPMIGVVSAFNEIVRSY